MKTVWDVQVREELVNRITSLKENSQALWGKMSVNQMLTHGALWDEMVLRNKHFKRPLIGILLGRMFLKKELKDDSPMRHNNPTVPDLIVKEAGADVASLKNRWITLINEYGAYSLPDHSFVHPFFGKMTRAQVGYFAYKHIDHHMRQFGS